ncbi:acyl-CoA thioesterase [Abyssalbus ytuae]|uniref:Acyl-CoA thioesterase n=1 Tax=Abyssalbus ytuae TaxID=2926907 RepID=A0A9E7A1L7_9FLAO|nr:thioesterase family protein [Abyssalbus ytuae]UOB19342.1 acyl-CoA thioesterase [Abyssalbus ytuae]
MITDEIQIRPRYGEVDQMGYVYHANYISYCHLGRTELLRKYGIHDKVLEDNNLILPVISFEIKYIKPAFYDDLLTIKTIIKTIPEVRFNFEFEINNENNQQISKAKSTVVFVNLKSRFPKAAPEFIKKALRNPIKTPGI